ncbi:hypothetical protein ACL02S_16685 [Nocardia sp. 004]|uniref:hypothetical protein n=1 Tax=Nocardia sp. 004 TaxID=3385978 RepID=UPI0039A0FCDE
MRRLKQVAIAAVALSVLVACSGEQTESWGTSPAAITPVHAEHTMRDLCEPTMKLVRDELRLAPYLRIRTPKDLDAAFGRNGNCSLIDDVSPAYDISFIAFVWVRRITDEDLLDRIQGYQKSSDYSEEMWIEETRSRIEFVTTVDGWMGIFQIGEPRTDVTDGLLELTEEQKKRAGEFIIELMRTLKS